MTSFTCGGRKGRKASQKRPAETQNTNEPGLLAWGALFLIYTFHEWYLPLPLECLKAQMWEQGADSQAILSLPCHVPNPVRSAVRFLMPLRRPSVPFHDT